MWIMSASFVGINCCVHKHLLRKKESEVRHRFRLWRSRLTALAGSYTMTRF
jgi:hypothetical protein